MKTFLMVCLLLLNLNIANAESTRAKPALTFNNIVIPEAPPVAAVMVAYMNIQNSSASEQVIIKITSPQFKRVEIHKMSMENGVMSMEQMKQLSIKAKQKIILKSGDLHVMLIKPIKRLKNGSPIELTFKLATGEQATINTHVQFIDLNNKHQNHH